MIALETWEQRCNRLKQWAPPPGLETWLKETNLEFGCGQAALDAIGNLSRGAPAVVAGQQAGLLTGPMYTIYKAASAVILARRLSKILERTVVPVFWLASEDHDFAEVRWAAFPVGEDLRQLVFPGEYGLTPAREIPLSPGDVEDIVRMLEELLPPTEFTRDLLTTVKESAGKTFSSWCAGLLSRLFRDEGLIIFDSCGLPVRLAGSSVFAMAVERGPDIHGILAEKAGAMKASGRRPGLAVPGEHSHLFLLRQGLRLGLLREGDKFVDRNHTVSLSAEQLLKFAEQEPWNLSPNVALRPLIQERALPVLAVLGGPGELAYMEQLKPVYAMMGMEQPPILPRLGGLLVEPAIARLLVKHNLTPSDAAEGLDSWLEGRLERADTMGIGAAFAGLRNRIQEAYGKVIPDLAELDSQLADLGGKNLDKVLEQVNWLEKRTMASHHQKHRELHRHVQRLQTALAPLGKKQERLHNCLWYLNKYGPDFIKFLLEQNLKPDLLLQLQEMR